MRKNKHLLHNIIFVCNYIYRINILIIIDTYYFLLLVYFSKYLPANILHLIYNIN